MQTFLPFESFAESAVTLDRQRLGKQRVETLQIMQTLIYGVGWVHHPAVKMWAGYEWQLLLYQEAVCNEWTGRGYRDTCLEKTTRLYLNHLEGGDDAVPFWLGDAALHRSHQSNLIRKYPGHYRQYFPNVPDNLEYVWPV